MPRKARIDAPGAVHHIIARGIEQSSIFRDDQDRYNFINRLGELVNETQTRCFAWALIPNHFHLLLKTGKVPISSFMSRLLTGYAIGHNRRHNRSGHLFQNRYKSILCQQDVYFKELVRYIHLNPLRAGVVNDMAELDRFRFAGHCYVLNKRKNDWQSVNKVLAYFGSELRSARRKYREYVLEGLGLGRQPSLAGGGLVRSAGGWSAVATMRKSGLFKKSDERILGDEDFVNRVLSETREAANTRYRLAAQGIELEDIILSVSELLSLNPRAFVGPSKERTVVKGRAMICYWAVRELGVSMTDLARYLKIAVSTVSAGVKKGEQIVNKEGLVLTEILNMKI